jgi:hypothetical protein
MTPSNPTAFLCGTEQFSLRNVYGNIILRTLEDALGQQTLDQLLWQAELPHYIGRYPARDFASGFRKSYFNRLFDTLATRFGPRRQKTLARQCGRAIAAYLFAEQWGRRMYDLPIRKLDTGEREAAGLRVISNLLGEFCVKHPVLYDSETHYAFALESCAACRRIAVNKATSHLMLGFVEEGLYIFTLGETRFRGELGKIMLEQGPVSALRVTKARAPQLATV